MALPLSNTFETGLADETAITDLNSDDGAAGNAWDAVVLVGASAAVYDTARAAHGTLSARITQDGANGALLRWLASHGAQTEVAGRLYIYRTAHPTPDGQWMILPQNAGGTDLGLVRWDTGGTLTVFDSTLGTSTTSTATVPLNEWVRIEWWLRCRASGATGGFLRASFFHGDDSQPIETVQVSGNTGTVVEQLEFGQPVGLATGGSFWLDDIRVEVPVGSRSQHLDFDYSR